MGKLMYLYDNTIKIIRENNIYTSLNKLHGFKIIHYSLLLKIFGLSIKKSNKCVLVKNKISYLLKNFINNRKDLDIKKKEFNLVNLDIKVKKFPIHGQRTHSNARTSKL